MEDTLISWESFPFEEGEKEETGWNDKETPILSVSFFFYLVY